MSLKHIRATFECDGCGRWFLSEMDTADEGALFDLAEESLRGSNFEGYVGHANRDRVGFTSVQAGKHLCPSCTKKVDDHVPEDREATADEVAEATSP